MKTQNNFKIGVYAVMVMFLLTGNLFAYEIHPFAGKTSAAFLKIPPGANNTGKGEVQSFMAPGIFDLW
jgi:hypothetical protein